MGWAEVSLHAKSQLDSSSCFNAILACDRQLNRQTDTGRQHIYCAGIASHGKNGTEWYWKWPVRVICIHVQLADQLCVILKVMSVILVHYFINILLHNFASRLKFHESSGVCYICSPLISLTLKLILQFIFWLPLFFLLLYLKDLDMSCYSWHFSCVPKTTTLLLLTLNCSHYYLCIRIRMKLYD